MKNLLLLALVLFFILPAAAQNSRSLEGFEKIVISPKIEVELIKGDSHTITWEAFNVDDSKVYIDQTNNKLSVYLENARFTPKCSRGKFGLKYPIYDADVKVKATITYVNLKSIEIRGEEYITIHSELDTDKKMVVKAYGASKIKIEGVKAKKLKTVLIGENELEIKSGTAKYQKVKTIGENSIISNNLNSTNIKANAIGENHLSLNVSDMLQVWAIGASDFRVIGNPNLHKALVIGENDIRLKH